MTEMNRRAALGGLALSAVLAACQKFDAKIDRPVMSELLAPVQVPGGKVWTKTVNKGGSGTPLLLFHGGPGAGHDYLTSLEKLAEDRPVVLYDQLGCGLSDAPADPSIYTIARSVQEVDAVRKALGLEKVILYGHSWGSLLAMEYLIAAQPAGVEKLILAGASPSIPQAVAGMKRLIAALPDGAGAKIAALEAQGKQATPEYQALVGEFYAQHLCRVPMDKWPPYALKTMETLAKSPAYAVMNGPNEFTITGVIKDWDRRADLGKIALPTLITTGEFDEITLDCHEALRDGIKGSRLEVMKGCSHLTMIEQPDAYNALLKGFIG